MKYLIFFFFFLTLSTSHASIKSMYVAGGCFWCVEEVYEKVEGVISVHSGYSGGYVENPTYQEVVLGNTGHIEAVEIKYDSSLIKDEQLVKLLFLNIDPFDDGGQFCDRGHSYKSAFFTNDETLKIVIDNFISKIENNHDQKVQTLVLPFKNFYLAEDYHQDYYKKNPVRYNYYKFSCGREQRIKQLKINLK
ncbi:peptide-methionine (S)-S-oxide reductase MsrA [Alphaproteobacteria bacterium]|jgi:peptide-methionine (S)-S-oxide reductase|nr:peptide-methionine (S)-S-oxide reductase MsrA [Alphaproteobacteria bacterium]MDB2371601.1 peptide-methionine (S)-S-oxide reductase MsrA [Alphaproteobacteria bacterium]|tara:strand:- start:1106 stop:1681 length:576 start_codon:yes stop_codon:yes gene_type:complete